MRLRILLPVCLFVVVSSCALAKEATETISEIKTIVTLIKDNAETAEEIASIDIPPEVTSGGISVVLMFLLNKWRNRTREKRFIREKHQRDPKSIS